MMSGAVGLAKQEPGACLSHSLHVGCVSVRQVEVAWISLKLEVNFSTRRRER